jgi:DNA-binding SARP family transcriptional activator
MGPLEIRLLGTLSAERDGELITRFQSHRVRNLFSYLLLNRERAHPREYLAGLFWAEMDESRARHCLNTTLWRLQIALGQQESSSAPHLCVDSQTIGFNTASDFQLDVADFESHCAWAERAGSQAPERQAELYRQAVSLYRADLLLDCYEDWCLLERERLRVLYLRALGQLLAYHAAHQEYDAAIDFGLRILACDPLREEVHRDLIRLYVDANQPAAALRQYHACEHILSRELGVDPMPETQALLSELIGQNAPVRVAARVAPSSTSVNPGEQFVSALAHLDEVAGALERAWTQLRETTAMVQDMAEKLGYLPPAGLAQTPGGKQLDVGQARRGHKTA